MNTYITFWKRAFDFKGRTSRKDFWITYGINIIVSFLISFLLVGAFNYGSDALLYGVEIFASLFSIVILVPSLSILIRRLHDTNRSGWWYFIALVPVVGGIVLLVFTLLPGVEPNNYVD